MGNKSAFGMGEVRTPKKGDEIEILFPPAVGAAMGGAATFPHWRAHIETFNEDGLVVRLGDRVIALSWDQIVGFSYMR